MDDLLLAPVDLALLAELQRDMHATNQGMGERLHLSASQVSRRIQRLEAMGLIQAYVALLDPSLLGLNVRAFTYVTLARHGGEEGEAFERAVDGIPEILDCYSISGGADYMLQIVTASLADLSEVVLKPLTRLPGVSNIQSSIALQRIKSSTALPLTQLSRPRTVTRRARLVQREG